MSMNENNDVDLKNLLQEAFESTNKDKNYNARKALVGLIPQIGSALAEFYTTYVTNPAQERLLYFLENLVGEFETIKNTVKGFTIESLESDPIFTTMLIRSMETVRRNHQKEKILLVKNLLWNSVLITSVNDDLKLLFLDLADELKVSQFDLLFLTHNYGGYSKKQALLDDIDKNKTLYSILLNKLVALELISFESVHQELQYIYEKANQQVNPALNFVGDDRDIGLKLFKRNMTNSENINLLISLLEQERNCMTDLGNLFIEFLKSPIEDS